MKVRIDKHAFLKSWSMAERCTGASSAGSIFSSVLLVAEYDAVELRATNIRTAVVCKAEGVEVIEPGTCALPVKGVSDLFNKAPGDGFDLTVTDGRAAMVSGKNRYRFATYHADSFPKLPSSSAADLFCSVRAGDLMLAITQGSLCASLKDEHPQYLSSALFELSASGLTVVSTDKRRLALSCIDTDTAGDPANVLLPLSGLRDLQKIINSLPDDTEVKIARDSAQTYFTAANIEFAVREVESKFPPYVKLLGGATSSAIMAEKSDLISAIERVEIVVRDYNRTVRMEQSDKTDGMILSGQSPAFGEIVEHVPAALTGERVFNAFNTRFFLEALKVVDGDTVQLSICASNQFMLVSAAASDKSKCLIAPVDVDDGNTGPTPAQGSEA